MGAEPRPSSCHFTCIIGWKYFYFERAIKTETRNYASAIGSNSRFLVEVLLASDIMMKRLKVKQRHMFIVPMPSTAFAPSNEQASWTFEEGGGGVNIQVIPLFPPSKMMHEALARQWFLASLLPQTPGGTEPLQQE